MIRKYITLLLILTAAPVFADFFYFPAEYNAVYNEKVTLEIEISKLKRQFNNDKTALEKEIAGLNDKISHLEKLLQLEKDGRSSDRESLQRQIADLHKKIEILRDKSGAKERQLADENSRLTKDYLAQIDDLRKQLEDQKRKCLEDMEAMKNDFNKKSRDYETRIASLEQELGDLQKLTESQKKELSRLSDQAGELEKQLQAEIQSGQIRLKRAFNKITINIDDKISFDSGSANLKPGIKNALDKIATILSNYPENNISVEGHTDNVPIKTARFRDNWQLSSERALSVLAYLMGNNKINPEKISVAGFGEHQPIVPNDTPENRSLNRRVDIVVVPRVTAKK